MINLNETLTDEEIREVFAAAGIKEKDYSIEGDYAIVRHQYANRDSKYGFGVRKLRRIIEVASAIRTEEFYILGRSATEREAEYMLNSIGKEKL